MNATLGLPWAAPGPARAPTSASTTMATVRRSAVLIVPSSSSCVASAVHVDPERARHLLSHVPKAMRLGRVKDDRIAGSQIVFNVAHLDAQATREDQAEFPAEVVQGPVGASGPRRVGVFRQFDIVPSVADDEPAPDPLWGGK